MAETDRVTVPRPSAALVLARETAEDNIAVFMVRRHARSDFVPDVFVFPGGSVMELDRAAERAPDLCAPAPTGATALGAGFRVAALRECFEEAGVLLARRDGSPLVITVQEHARFSGYRLALANGTLSMAEMVEREGLTLATDALLHWSHWITPEAWPKRFTTHFFLAAMPVEQQAAHDQLETTDGVWVTPEEALARHHEGAFPLVFATLYQLQELTGLRTIAKAEMRFAGVPVRTMRPYIVSQDGEELILLPDEP
ncbi:MAG TPA: NUDIX hydrolase [Chloroflexota bacterium]|nr:NUDIX hydrolase [Chloroflexota bacterium]